MKLLFHPKAEGENVQVIWVVPFSVGSPAVCFTSDNMENIWICLVKILWISQLNSYAIWIYVLARTHHSLVVSSFGTWKLKINLLTQSFLCLPIDQNDDNIICRKDLWSESKSGWDTVYLCWRLKTMFVCLFVRLENWRVSERNKWYKSTDVYLIEHRTLAHTRNRTRTKSIDGC